MINDQLKNIIGFKITSITRACDLICICFKKDVEMWLNLQCMMRIIRNGEIKVSSRDLFYPSKKNELKKKFDWTEIGANQYDESLSNIINELIGSSVIKVINFDNRMDLIIVMDNGYSIEIIHDTVKEYELYRFFTEGDDQEHYVVDGNMTE